MKFWPTHLKSKYIFYNYFHSLKLKVSSSLLKVTKKKPTEYFTEENLTKKKTRTLYFFKFQFMKRFHAI